jgi:uncharacterized membrane protein
MVNRFRQYWYNMTSSFWFVPGLIILGAMLLAITLIKADEYITSDVVENWPRFLGAGAESSRNMLETIASSMITVAGVVFSITLVALSLASSQYSSRVLQTFMNDRATQVVLGIFLGIFGYCLVVLMAIRDNGEGDFLPTLAVLVGLLFGFLGIALLVFFIHHIAKTIQASRILAAVYEETVAYVDVVFPDPLDGEEIEAHVEPDHPGHAWHVIPANKTGYIQQIDTAPLLKFARDHDVVVRMERGVGEFIIEGAPAFSILAVYLPEDTDPLRLNKSFTVGRQRSPTQDVAFGIRQLEDVALKALSPGVNDTTTAVMVIDYLTAILVRLADRHVAKPCVIEEGKLRLLFRGPTYSALAGTAFNQIRLNAEGNMAILERLFGSLEVLAGLTRSEKRRQALLLHARDMEETAHRSIASTSDRRRIHDMSTRVIALLDSGKDK